jgi:prepilin-type N-terminal cleavage/methylation domain-containing protein
MARPTLSARGVSLIEVMIAMAVLTVGLLAMWNLHVIGLTSTAAGRRHSVATAIARELAAGLERLPFGDPLLGDHVAGAALPAGALFGSLVEGAGTVREGAREWSDAAPVPGVRLAGELPQEAAGYERRWTVWGLLSSDPGAAGMVPGVKLVAVSVVWRDPPFARPREVVLYTQVVNPATLVTGLGTNP